MGRFPGETSCLTLVWAVLDLLITHQTNGINFTALDRQHLKRATYTGNEQTIPEEATAAQTDHHREPNLQRRRDATLLLSRVVLVDGTGRRDRSAVRPLGGARQSGVSTVWRGDHYRGDPSRSAAPAVRGGLGSRLDDEVERCFGGAPDVSESTATDDLGEL